MKSVIKTMLAAMLLLPAVTGCKKNTEPHAEGNRLNAAIQKVKTWFEAQPAVTGRQKNTAAAGSNMPAAALQWSRAAYFAAERSYVVPATLPQGNAPAFAYLLITEDGQGAPAKAQYTLLLPDKKSMGSAAIDAISVTPGFLQGSSMPAGFTGGMAQFTGSGSPAGSAVYKGGQPVNASAVRLHAKKATAGSSEAARPPCTNEIVCTDWYWQTYVDGILIDEEYLFTTCVCDGGAGGGGMGDDIDPLLVQFNNYVQLTSSPATVNAPNSVAGPDPITFFFTWVVARGAFSPWFIYAKGQMDYYHKLIYNLQLNATEHIYDIVGYKTLTTFYSGTNMTITSTWTPLSIVDQVFDNNSTYARGTTQVTGTIKHKANYSVTIPLLGTFPPERIDPVDNSCTVKPS